MTDSASLVVKAEIILATAHLKISVIKTIVNTLKDIKNYINNLGF